MFVPMWLVWTVGVVALVVLAPLLIWAGMAVLAGILEASEKERRRAPPKVEETPEGPVMVLSRQDWPAD